MALKGLIERQWDNKRSGKFHVDQLARPPSLLAPSVHAKGGSFRARAKKGRSREGGMGMGSVGRFIDRSLGEGWGIMSFGLSLGLCLFW